MTKKKMKTVKAWAIIKQDGKLLPYDTDRFAGLFETKEVAARLCISPEERVVRVSISELPPKRKGKR